MSGLCCGSANAQTWAGSQWHQLFNWVNDALPGNISQFMSLTIAAGFGPIYPPFLATVSQLTGTGYNALAAVATVPLPTVFPVDILIIVGSNYLPQRWYLVSGTTAGGAGICIPNDYNAVTNQKYWVQLT